MAGRATVGVKPRPESRSYRMHLGKSVLAVAEKLNFSRGQPGDRSSRPGRPSPRTRISLGLNRQYDDEQRRNAQDGSPETACNFSTDAHKHSYPPRLCWSFALSTG